MEASSAAAVTRPVNTPAPRIVVIGGGISGLAAAHRLHEVQAAEGRVLDLLLLEASGRLGGAIRTETREGFLLEHGPDSFLTSKPAAVELCQRLGLSDQLIPTREGRRATLIVRGGRLLPLPPGFLLLAPTRLGSLLTTPLFSTRGKLRMALDLVLPRRRGGDDESLADFVRRRLGPEALARVAQPMIGGIYTADPERLSVRATMPQLLDYEARHGSVIRGLMRQRGREGGGDDSGVRYRLFVSLADGMQRLVEALRARLAGGLRCHAPVESASRVPNGWQLRLRDGATVEAAAVIVALPAFAAAGLLRDQDSALAGDLAGIEYASTAAVNLAYRAEDASVPEGFGFVVPAIERRKILACTFAHRKFPGRAPEGGALLRAFVGGALQPEFVELDDEQLVAICHEELRALLGVRGAPRFAVVSRHPRAMPQYHVGHLARVARIQERARTLPGLFLCGNGYEGVGIPDCIKSGETAALAALAWLSA